MPGKYASTEDKQSLHSTSSKRRRAEIYLGPYIFFNLIEKNNNNMNSIINDILFISISGVKQAHTYT